MQHRFEWSDYNLKGAPAISLEDYTFSSFGCDQLFNNYMSELKKIRIKKESVRWLLIDFWGRGKSTFAYNLCSRINTELFFGEQESPVLALFVDYPQKAENLLEYTYENGLPFPWLPSVPKESTQFERKQLFITALKILATGWVRKGCQDKSYEKLAKHQNIQHLFDNFEIKANYLDIIKRINAHKQLTEDAVDFLTDYFKHLSQNCKSPIYEPIKEVFDSFPGLLYLENSSDFLYSFSTLFREPGRKLRNFMVFHSICEFANFHVLLAIDEAAEWDSMAKTGLDDFFLKLLPSERLSAILISRADIEKSMRGQKRIRYFLLRTYLKTIALPEPNQNEKYEIAKGIMATNREKGDLQLFPFSEGFILSLFNLSIRCGHFNTRMFVRALSNSLKLSLDWERDNVEIEAKYIGKKDLLELLSEDLKFEDKKGLQPLDLVEKSEEIRAKAETANQISAALLSGIAVPPTKYMYEIINEVFSEIHGLSPLSDIEILAYTTKERRSKVYKIIKELKETSVSERARSYLKDWVRKKVKTKA